MNQTSPQNSRRPPRWPLVMLTFSWLVGLAWMIAYYADPTLPVLNKLGNWNLLIASLLLMLGAVFAVILLVVSLRSTRRP
ncbi:cell division protein CrgA [Streptosporangiaceae bacterium NEAU-GS5]|nr:cell division protein CrgA [Streptosporangiaceae bacterium NEAU-GS5]